jgi:hypothetical protein
MKAIYLTYWHHLYRHHDIFRRRNEQPFAPCNRAPEYGRIGALSSWLSLMLLVGSGWQPSGDGFGISIRVGLSVVLCWCWCWCA